MFYWVYLFGDKYQTNKTIYSDYVQLVKMI